MEFFDNLFHSFAEIAHKATADATGVHLCYLYSRFLQKSAVNTDLTEFVFNKDYLFSCISFFKKFFDERSLSRAQKA